MDDERPHDQQRYPAAIEDVSYGIRWARTNLKAKRIGGLGTSSGGQQIVLSALQPEKFGQDARLDFVVACWPILDPFARYQMAKARGLKNLVDAHHAFWPDEAAMKEGNPQLVLDRGEEMAKPPMLILQGTADENVEHVRADRFAEAYRARGGDVELVKFDGQPHTFIVKDPGSSASRDALERMTSFIRNRS